MTTGRESRRPSGTRSSGPFSASTSRAAPTHGGTGLGLTIARDVVRSHGGDVVLEDAPEGGLRARIWLPV